MSAEELPRHPVDTSRGVEFAIAELLLLS